MMPPLSRHIVSTLADVVNARLKARGAAPTAEAVITELDALRLLRRNDNVPMPMLATTHCVVCGHKAEPLDTEDPNKIDVTTMLRGAGIIELSFGYGSKYDTAWVFGVICEECAKAFISTTAMPMSDAGASPAFEAYTTRTRED